MDPVIIVGSGLAGYTLAREVRKLDPQVALQIVTRDDGSAYSKPMLSNALSKGKTAEQLASAHAGQVAEQISARIDTGTRLLAIDRDAHRIVTDKGDFTYSRLVLALGADPIQLTIEGDGAAEVMSVNDLADYGHFRQALLPGSHVAIMGAGLIGCEFANDLLASGHRVSVFDPAERALGLLLPAACSRDLQDALAGLGIQWHFETTVNAIHKQGRGYALSLSDGSRMNADLVLSAVGLRPRIGIAGDAGLACRRGIQVDRTLSTSDADIFALGDCAEVEGLVLPFVMPIMHAARALAKTLCGTPTPVSYPAMPVVVKTPTCPLVVAPPATGANGEWETETLGPGSTKAGFYNEQRQLLGFALTGEAAAQKQALTRELPPVMA